MNISIGRYSRTLAGVLLALAVFVPMAHAEDGALLSGAELTHELQRGGYVVLIRHPATDPTQADTDPLHPDNVAAQRRLTDKGRAEATAMGQAWRSLKIPVGSVASSKFQRAIEAAQLAGFEPGETSLDYTEGGLVVSTVENQRRAAALKKRLATQPDAGKNNVIVSHRPNILDAVGKDVFDVSEGEALVIRPQDGGSFKLIGRIKIDAWPELARSKP